MKAKRSKKKKNYIQIICSVIILVASLFIMACLGYFAYFKWFRPVNNKSELSLELEEIKEYYAENDKASDNDGTDKTQEAVIEDVESEEVVDEDAKPKEAEICEAEENTVAGENVKPEDRPKNNDDIDVNELNSEIEAVADDDWVIRENLTDYQESDPSDHVTAVQDISIYRELINQAKMSPRYPDNQDLRAVLDDLIPRITGNCTDTYDKVKACYDYLINSCSYSKTTKYDYEYDAYLLLTQLHGSCTYYAAAFHYMMLYIGLDDQLVSGYRMLYGKSSFHRWNEIRINDKWYLFDTQWEDTLSRGGGIQYTRFCKAHEEVNSLYIFE